MGDKVQATDGWYYAHAGDRVGPCSWEELWGLAKAGTVGADDLVWHASLPQWVKAADAPGLNVAFGEADATPPSSEAVEAAAAAVPPPAGSTAVEGPDAPSATEPNALMCTVEGERYTHTEVIAYSALDEAMQQCFDPHDIQQGVRVTQYNGLMLFQLDLDATPEPVWPVAGGLLLEVA